MAAALTLIRGANVRASRQAAADAIRHAEGFRASNVIGGPGQPARLGWLPDELRGSARQADYTVMSYDTPIAWRAGGEWIVPRVRYSVTTDRHQTAVRDILAMIGGL